MFCIVVSSRGNLDGGFNSEVPGQRGHGVQVSEFTEQHTTLTVVLGKAQDYVRLLDHGVAVRRSPFGHRFKTPAAVHHGHAHALFQQRANTLDIAFAAHPKRFKGNCPQPPKLPIAAWINPPKQEPALKKIPDPSTLN